MKLSARVLFLLGFFALFFAFIVKPAVAQEAQTITTQVNQFQSPNLNPDVPQNQHSYAQSVVIEIMSAMICQIGGLDPTRADHRCLGIDQETGKIGFVENGGGAIGVIGSFIAYTFIPPANTADYVRYATSNFGIAKNTYAQQGGTPTCANSAQGVGFCGIKPLTKMWIAMRNLTYLLFVIIFAVIGVAIMLRVHIDPRTIMTIENQIPKIIIGILLVTFSFAIAGLLIDVMFVSIYLIGSVLAPHLPPTGNTNLSQIATSPTPFDITGLLWEGGFTEISDGGFATVYQFTRSVFDGSQVQVSPGIGDFLTDILSAVAGLIIGLIAYFIILLALLYTVIRLWVVLVVAYINILLDIVFAPFWFLMGLLPGSSLGVGAWFRDMLGNLAVFPAAIAMFMLAKIFSGFAESSTDPLFIPPLTGGGIGAGNSVFAGIITLGFLFMTPHILQITKAAVKAPKLDFGPVFQMPGAAAGALTNIAKSTGRIRHEADEYRIGNIDPVSGNTKYSKTGAGRAFIRGIFR